jgi:MoxR-like ATPase
MEMPWIKLDDNRCQARVETEQEGTSIVLNSIGGRGASRLEGTTKLLQKLAENRLSIKDIGYHPEGRKFKSLNIPASDSAARSDHRNFAQEMFTSLGRTGANQGSRLRIRFGTQVSEDRLQQLLHSVSTAAYNSSDLGGGAPENVRNTPDFSEIVTQASRVTADVGLRFGDDASHRVRVRNFLASLATRRFVVLAGLSGSGKTQLARRVGQWLGQTKVVPVRPDWTGPEALLGFADALQGREGGSPVWHVPPVLDFLLKARKDSHQPFTLVLDEMNLAHVERYFADVLSGMETGEGCLPAVERTPSATVLRGATDAYSFPDNVFVVGTINVDETTYQFSPKVLDRASTVEFRVVTEALAQEQAELVANVQAASAETREAFLGIARDPRWHRDHAPNWAGEFADRVRGIHRLLARDRFEFGHRTYLEAQRLAALLAADGATQFEALDTFILQKVLPRIHGGRKRLERCLETLVWCCITAPNDAEAVKALATPRAPTPPQDAKEQMPRSLEKVKRMRQTLLENQFAGFSE